MTKKMYDCAYLPVPTPTGYEVAAGYVMGKGAAHLWTVQDWQRAASLSRFLLPIATTWPPYSNGAQEGAQDAQTLMTLWDGIRKQLNWKLQPCAFALDVEEGIAQEAHNAGYIDSWRTAIRSYGHYDIVYSSRSTSQYLGYGPRWIAFGMLGGDVKITQTKFDGDIDEDLVDDSVPLFDTKATDTAPPPSPKGHEMTYMFTCHNHPYPAARTLTYITNGITYRAMIGENDFNVQKLIMAQQGINFDATKVPDLDWNGVVSHMVEVKPA